MKRCLSLVLPLLASAVFAQDPGFRPAEGLRPVAPAPAAPAAPAVKDDTAAAVAQMGSMDRLDSTYLLKKGDTVSLRIVEDTSQKAPLSLKVQASGNINAPFINLVPAAGKTCKEVAFYMKKELEKEHFRVATVIVSLEDTVPTKSTGALIGPPSNFITIYGQVQRQGKYEITPEEELTASQAILKAGGFSQFAKDTMVSVIRKYPKMGNVRIIVNLRNVMMKGKLDYDIPIRGGDVIIVDEKLVNF
jgi:protein involved in polysaccharide export with SLBB domain